MPDAQLLKVAREIITGNQQHLIFQVGELRQRADLSLADAKTLILQALNERDGIYYLVTPGQPGCDGPYHGLAAAQQVASSQPIAQVVLVAGATNSVHEAAERFLRALPDPTDAVLVHQLLFLLSDADHTTSDVIDSAASRNRLLDYTRERLARES